MSAFAGGDVIRRLPVTVPTSSARRRALVTWHRTDGCVTRSRLPRLPRAPLTPSVCADVFSSVRRCPANGHPASPGGRPRCGHRHTPRSGRVRCRSDVDQRPFDRCPKPRLDRSNCLVRPRYEWQRVGDGRPTVGRRLPWRWRCLLFHCSWSVALVLGANDDSCHLMPCDTPTPCRTDLTPFLGLCRQLNGVPSMLRESFTDIEVHGTQATPIGACVDTITLRSLNGPSCSIIYLVWNWFNHCAFDLCLCLSRTCFIWCVTGHAWTVTRHVIV